MPDPNYIDAIEQYTNITRDNDIQGNISVIAW